MLAARADVRKTRSPHVIGDDHPLPPITAFHATFSVALQVSGSPASFAGTPVESGPRNFDQLAAIAGTASGADAIERKLLRFSISSSSSPRHGA